MKKLLALLIATLVVFTGTVGCKANDDGALSQFKDRPNEVVVYYSSNAYGGDWLTKIAEKYMTTHNDDTYINVKKTVEQTSDLAKIESGVAVGDLYLLDMHLEDKTFAYAKYDVSFNTNLTDILNFLLSNYYYLFFKYYFILLQIKKLVFYKKKKKSCQRGRTQWHR